MLHWWGRYYHSINLFMCLIYLWLAFALAAMDTVASPFVHFGLRFILPSPAVLPVHKLETSMTITTTTRVKKEQS
jgi:hypothetical protein